MFHLNFLEHSICISLVFASIGNVNPIQREFGVFKIWGQICPLNQQCQSCLEECLDPMQRQFGPQILKTPYWRCWFYRGDACGLTASGRLKKSTWGQNQIAISLLVSSFLLIFSFSKVDGNRVLGEFELISKQSGFCILRNSWTRRLQHK